MPEGGIYYIVNLCDGKATAYVGSTYDFRKRRLQHQKDLRRGVHANVHLQAAYNKYGSDAFEFAALETIEDADMLVGREQFWLDRFKASGPIYNLALVAGSPMKGRRHSEETRRRLSEIGKGRQMPPRTKEHRRRLSRALKGRAITPEWRAKMSAARRGRPSGRKGIKHTAEARQKMSDALRGRKLSDEHIHKMSESRARPYPAFVHQDTGDVIAGGQGLNRMCKQMGLDTSAMSKVVRGLRLSHKGWILAE